jgi:hypothetical protein
MKLKPFYDFHCCNLCLFNFDYNKVSLLQINLLNFFSCSNFVVVTMLATTLCFSYFLIYDSFSL